MRRPSLFASASVAPLASCPCCHLTQRDLGLLQPCVKSTRHQHAIHRPHCQTGDACVLRAMDTSHRRTFNRHSDANRTYQLPARSTASNLSSSSTSSDILVAPAHRSKYNPQHPHPRQTMPVTAVVRGDILIVKGIRPMLERLQRRDYHADANSAADNY